MAIGLIVVFCGLFYYIYNRRANTDYEGQIVDRWAGYSEGNEGSHPYFRLRVQSDDGQQFVVNVNPNVSAGWDANQKSIGTDCADRI